MRVIVLLVVASGFAGCTAGEGLGFGGGAEGARDPYYKEWRAWIDGSHLQHYAVPVEAGAEALNVTLLLEPRTNGVPVPGVALARLDVVVTDPTGTTLAEGKADVHTRSLSLVVDDLAPGTYTVRVSGVGTSSEVDGARYGDAYAVSAEVLYAA